MITALRRRLTATADEGIALVSVLLVMAVLGALTITATAITVNNLGNSSRDRQGLAALATSDAGVAQAITYLRGANVSSLKCLESNLASAACTSTTTSWTSKVAPMQVRLDGVAGSCVATSDCFKVWIGTVTPYDANCPSRTAATPKPCTGVYRIHSTGIAGSGPGARRLAVDVELRPYNFPLGVYTELGFSGNGTPRIHRESIFSAGCMINRTRDSQSSGGGTAFEWDSAANRPVLDLFYNQPAAAHTVGSVSTANNGDCSSRGNNDIHASGPCNTTFPYDQDGSQPTSNTSDLVSGDGCYGLYTDPANGVVYPKSSKFTMNILQSVYGYRPRGLTDAQYDALKAQAQSQGLYNVSTANLATAVSNAVAAGAASPVVFWDDSSIDVTLDDSDFPGFMRGIDQTEDCSSKALTIVRLNGPLSYHGGSGPRADSTPRLAASIFVPDGTVTGQGGRDVIGTVFAQTIDLGGSPDFFMDGCFANNPPGGTLDVKVTNFREDDGTDVN